MAGQPTPYMISGERIEEEDVPTSGLITFIDNDTVRATFTDDDSGFIEEMVGGKICIKDAYVADENYSQDSQITILDDVEIANAGGDDIVT